MTSTDFDLQALDGYRLRATHHAPSSAERGDRPVQCLVIGSATATPRGYYRRFAAWCASQGLDVFVADYRGIGESKQGSLRGFEMAYADWSQHDLGALIEKAQACARLGNMPTPDQTGQDSDDRVWLVGHSLGGHALGQLPDLRALRAAYVCGSGAGWSGWMPGLERWKVSLMWNVLGPVATRIAGYQPMSWFGMGEDIPMGAYRDWKYWCSHRRYFFDATDARSRAIAARFEDVRFPVAAMVATDDLWAPPRSRDAFFSGFKNAPVEALDLGPAELGGPCGHFGYFRPGVGERLWPQILHWLSGHGLRLLKPRGSLENPG
jgi:predicted alpha/beta hydrolase